jgi:hypothetical protein
MVIAEFLRRHTHIGAIRWAEHEADWMSDRNQAEHLERMIVREPNEALRNRWNKHIYEYQAVLTLLNELRDEYHERFAKW